MKIQLSIKFRIIILVLAVGVMLTFSISYHIPQKVIVNDTAYIIFSDLLEYDAPQSVNITGSLTKYRSFISPHRYDGMMLIDDEKYKTVFATYQSLREKLEMKYINKSDEILLHKPSSFTDTGDFPLTELVRVKWLEEGLFIVSIPAKNEEQHNGFVYYINAENADTAKQYASERFPNGPIDIGF